MASRIGLIGGVAAANCNCTLSTFQFVVRAEEMHRTPIAVTSGGSLLSISEVFAVAMCTTSSLLHENLPRRIRQLCLASSGRIDQEPCRQENRAQRRPFRL